MVGFGDRDMETRECVCYCVIFSGEKTWPHMGEFYPFLCLRSFGGTSPVAHLLGYGVSVQHHLDHYTCKKSRRFYEFFVW